MIIESVELVALPDAPTYPEKIYCAHMDPGEDMDLLPPLRYPFHLCPPFVSFYESLDSIFSDLPQFRAGLKKARAESGLG